MESSVVRTRSIPASRLAVAVVTVALLVGVSCGGSAATSPAPASAAPASAARASAAPAATSQPTDSGPTAAKPATMTVGFSAGLNWSPFYIGVEKGIFLKHGIDLKIKTFTSVQETPKALQVGDIQVSATVWSATVPAVAQGVPLRVISLLTGRPDVAIYDPQLLMVVRPGVTAQSVANLKGMRVAATFGGAGEAYVRSVLKKAGLDADKDVTLLNSSQPNMLALLQTQSVDAAGSTEPYASLIQLQLAGSRVLLRGGGGADTRAMVTAMDPWLKQNPVIADHFAAGLLDSQQYARQHLEETAVATSHYVSGIDVAVLTSAMKSVSLDPRWSSTVLQGIELASQDLVANGTIKALPKSSDILVLDLLTNYEKKYPEYFSDLK